MLDYKNKTSLRADDLRRRREEQQVEIRRQKREENITKRRNLALVDGPESDDEGSNLVCVFCDLISFVFSCGSALSFATLRRVLATRL